jgi:hypothetical protein
MLCIRENVDIGWSMLGLDNEVPVPDELKEAVGCVVQLLLELREKELQRTFAELGFAPQGCTSDSAPVVPPNVEPLGVLDPTKQNKATVDGAENEAALQMISAVTAESHICLDSRLPPMVDDSENERQLLFQHMMNPSPPIMRAGSGWFRRTPSRVAFRLQSGSSQLLDSPVRAMDLAAANKVVEDHLRLTLGDRKPPEDNAVAMSVSPLDSAIISCR